MKTHGLLFTVLRRLFGPKFRRTDPEMPISIVLLMRSPRVFTEAELIDAGEKAWQVPFRNADDNRHFVAGKLFVLFMKVGPFVLHFPAQARPYLDNPEETAKGFADVRLRNAWRQHRAWVSIDCMNKSADVEAEYCVIAKLAAELVDDNCLGVYLPHQGTFTANEGNIREYLQTIASLREIDVT